MTDDHDDDDDSTADFFDTLNPDRHDERYEIILKNFLHISGESTVLAAKGRHDPCVVPRAVSIVETMTALVKLRKASGSFTLS